MLLDIIYINILKNPSAIGLPAIFLFIAFIIYFSFRDGIQGGIITATITVLFYFYLIFSLHYKGAQFISGIETTVTLGLVYFFLAFVIGLLKQTIDNLLEKEADGRRRLEAIVEQLPVGIIITDNKGTITLANKQADSIMGIQTPIGFIAGSKNLIPSLYNDKPLNPSQTPLLLVLQKKKPVVGKEFLLQRKDGKNIDILVNATPIFGETGKVIAAALIFSDITQQKEMEQRKDDFVNMASHELKTPLTTMKIYSDLLGRKKKQYDKQDKKIVQNIQLQIQRLQQVVNDLLDVSRLQTGKLGLSKENFYINDLLKEIVDDLQPSTKQKLRIIKNVKKNIFADRFRVYQVLTNLIANAIKYSPDAKEIDIFMDKKKDFVIVNVKDYGIGIAKSQQKKIFERLYQVREAKGETYPGFGMGLYISQQIIQQHKGEIWVNSIPNEGATFSFSLPLRNSHSE